MGDWRGVEIASVFFIVALSLILHFSNGHGLTYPRQKSGIFFAQSMRGLDFVFQLGGDFVEAALQLLDPTRITLNPDCGFAPGSAAKVSLDEVSTKLKNEVEAAQRLRAKYS